MEKFKYISCNVGESSKDIWSQTLCPRCLHRLLLEAIFPNFMFFVFLVSSQLLRPFVPDRKLPFVQEYAVVSLREPKAFVREWSEDARLGQELHLHSTLNCHLVDYKNLTLFPLLQPFSIQGHATKKYTHSQQTEQMLHFNVFLEPLLITVGQHIIHTLNTARKAWEQVRYTCIWFLFNSHFYMIPT